MSLRLTTLIALLTLAGCDSATDTHEVDAHGHAEHAQPAAAAAPVFERAMADYEQQRFASAFDALASLADAGHRDAARIALLMFAHGPRLYGQRFDAEAARRARWVDAATGLSIVAMPRP